MFGEKTMETGNSSGATELTLGTSVAGWKTWRSQFADGTVVPYYAENEAGDIWEEGYGALTYGSPDKITGRVLIASSTDSLVDFAGVKVYTQSVPIGEFMNHMLAPLHAARPGWLQRGMMWLDYALGIDTTWVRKRATTAAAAGDIEEGRHYISPSIYVPSPRKLWENVGAANLVLDADDIGKVLAFDCAGGARTATLLASATAKHGFAFEVIAYGSAANGVTLIPNGSDAIDQAKVPPGGRVRVEWDGARDSWRVHAVSQAVPEMHIRGLTYGNNVSDATNDIDIVTGGCMSDDGSDWIAIAGTTKQLDVAAAADNGATPSGMLGPAAVLGNNDYLMYAIKNPATGETRVFAEKADTVPTLPSGFTKKRAFGWIKRSGGTIVACKTYETAGGGLELLWMSPTKDVSLLNTLTTSQRTDAVKVPLTFSTTAILMITNYDASAGSNTRVYNPDTADAGAPSYSAAPGATLGSNPTITPSPGIHHIRTSATGTVAARSSLATVDEYYIFTIGFIWARR